MRISDWSSDVCSSDLNRIGWAQTAINFGGLAGLTTVVMVMMLGQTRVLFAMSRDGLMPRSLAKTNAKGIPMRITLIVGGIVAVQIGRAACRERVCQYV